MLDVHCFIANDQRIFDNSSLNKISPTLTIFDLQGDFPVVSYTPFRVSIYASLFLAFISLSQLSQFASISGDLDSFKINIALFENGQTEDSGDLELVLTSIKTTFVSSTVKLVSGFKILIILGSDDELSIRAPPY